jgi:anti-anti-sigma factor
MLEIEIAADGRVVVSGRFDASQVEKAEAVFEQVDGDCIVDCSGLEYISSAGVGVLIATYKRLHKTHHSLRLTNVSDYVGSVLRYAGMSEIFAIEHGAESGASNVEENKGHEALASRDVGPTDETRIFTTITAGAIIGHYRVKSRLGAGGMGEVFLALDTQLNRDIALKFLPPHYSNDDSFKTRFMREARSAAALNHANIITIYEIAEHDGRMYIAMELVKGQALSDLLLSGKQSLDTALGIVTQVCSALSCAHRAGIIHRDIKADNIMIDHEGRVRLLDFGLARTATDERVTQVGTVVGTINYMSPEQARGEEVDCRSDVFSVGVVMYQLLTGELPFARDNMPSTVYAIVHEQPKPVSQFVSVAAQDLQQVLDRALAKDMSQRYQTIDELLADLKAMQTGRQISTASSSGIPAAVGMRSLAVLYLRNLGSPDDEYLCYGITEDLIVDLSRLGTIRVASLRSILKYKDSDEELDEIASKLNVGIILDGSIHKTGNAIRVSAQLVDVASGKNLWANRWEESLDNLPQVKRSLAEGISSVLDIDSDTAARAQVGTPEARDPQAYEYYLRGKYAFEQKKDSSDVDVALGLYRKALQEEPSLLAARAGVAEVLLHQGDHKQAADEIESALHEAEAENLRADRAMLYRLLARSHINRSHWDDAYDYGNRALEMSKELGDLVGEAEALAILLDILRRRSRFDDALTLFRRALEINRQLDNQQKEAEVLKNMGTVYLRKGEYDVSRSLFDEAARIAKRRNDASMEADCTGNTGVSYFHVGSYDEALNCYEEALRIHTRLGNLARQALWLNNIAIVYESRGEYRKALSTMEKVMEIHQELGDRGKYGLALGNSGCLLAALGDSERAMKYAKEAIEIAVELDFPLLATSAYDTLGLACLAKGNCDDAKSHYCASLEAAENAILRVNVAYARCGLGEVAFHCGEYSECQQQMKMALSVAKEIDHQEGQIKAAAYLAALQVKDGLFETGVARLREIARDAKKLGDPRFVLVAERLLGQSLLVSGFSVEDRQEGRTILQDAYAMAESKELALELRWIREALDSSRNEPIAE